VNASAERRQVRLHFKVLEPPKIKPEDLAANMVKVYGPYGIDVVVVPPVESLQAIERLKVLNDLWVDRCWLGSPTDDQKELFGHRNGVPVDEICVYFVRSTVDSMAGCASRGKADGFPKERPAAVVTSDPTPWTLAHECGHVLGLRHVDPVDHVMVSATWKITANPPVLDPAEVAKVKLSPFTKAAP